LLVPVLIVGLIGCQSSSSVTVTEYRPRTVPAEHQAPASEVFELVRWQPIVPVTARAGPSTAPVKQMPVEVEQVYAPRGSPLGFRRNQGQLIAVAGQTTKTLEEAHYEWKTVAGLPSDQSEARRRRSERFFGTIGAVIGIAVITAVVVYFVTHDSSCDCDN